MNPHQPTSTWIRERPKLRPWISQPERTAAQLLEQRWPIIVALAAGSTAIGFTAGRGQPGLALTFAVLPIGVAAAAWLALARRDLLLFGALALAFLGGPLNNRLSGGGGAAIYPADLIVGLALAGWLAQRLAAPTELRMAWPKTIITWPLVLLALTILVGVIRGHSRYGIGYLSEPTRLLAYAGVGACMIGMNAQRAYRGIVAVFYAGTVWQTIVGVYHLAAGTSQTSSSLLSTGGTRTLALSTAMYLAGALVLALLNLELDRRLLLHLSMAGLATFGIVISLGRTTFVAVGAVLPVLVIALRGVRRKLLSFAPLLLPVVVLMSLLILQIHPSLGSTLTARFTGRLSDDAAVVQRQHKNHAVLQGLSADPLFGFGFGRPYAWVSVDGASHTSTGDPENSYLWILAGGGIAALGAFFLLMATYFVETIRRARRLVGEARALVVFSASLAFVLFVNAITGPIFSDGTFALSLWIVLLLPSVAWRSRKSGSIAAGAARVDAPQRAFPESRPTE